MCAGEKRVNVPIDILMMAKDICLVLVTTKGYSDHPCKQFRS